MVAIKCEAEQKERSQLEARIAWLDEARRRQEQMYQAVRDKLARSVPSGDFNDNGYDYHILSL